MFERELDELEDEELPENTEDDEGEMPEVDDAEEASETLEDPEGELVVTIGDEKPEAEEQETAAAPQWVKDLRKENRELKKQLKAGSAASTQQRKTVGPKPKLADSDYDEAKHELLLDAWYEAKRDADKAERDAAESQANQQREWDARLQAHTKAKGALKVKDYDEAEAFVFEHLDATQQGILIGGADNSALVVLALKQNPKQLKELAAIKDPVKYSFAIAKLETKLKTTKRRPATAPEATVARSNTGGARASNATLEKLRAQADKTGDYSQVNAYRRKLRSVGK